jgi:hypothetical protein
VFDYRYHALSLAAVLIALAVGVLLGVAIGDANLVSSAKNGIVSNLRSDVRGAQQQSAQLQAQLAARDTFETALYPFAVNGQLANKKIGLLFLGGSSDQVGSLVREALTPTGSQLAMVGAVREPLDLAALGQAASGTQYTALATSPALVKQFGMRIGIQLVNGGQLVAKLRDRLLSSFNGQLGKLDGVVVARSDPSGLPADQAQVVTDFESGLTAGIAAAKVPAVGVELTGSTPSQIPWFKTENMASVDDLDTLAGRAALTFALGGAHGSYGVKPTAESLLPHVVSTPSVP